MKPSKQNQITWLAKSFTVITILMLTGCATFTSPKEKPVIEDRIGENNGTLAVTAERRIVIFKDNTTTDKATSICAEPSPDVAESISSTLRALAEASVKKGGNETTASIDASKAFATTISQLLVRSQGIQYLRDSMYALCQAKMNGFLGAMPAENSKANNQERVARKKTESKPANNTTNNQSNNEASSIVSIKTNDIFSLLFNNILENSNTLIGKEIENIEKMREEYAASRAEKANSDAQLRATEARASADAASDSVTKAAASANAAKTSAATAAAKATEATDAAAKAGGDAK